MYILINIIEKYELSFSSDNLIDNLFAEEDSD